MLTKLTLKKLQKLAYKDSGYLDVEDPEEVKERLYNKMDSLISRSASSHEYDEILKAQDNDDDGDSDSDNMDSAREDLYGNALDIFDRYNANPTIKSMCRDTKKSAKLRLAFFFGNEIEITEKQNKAYEQGTNDFYLYRGQGYTQADKDARFVKMIKHGNAMQTPNPADLINDADTIMNDLALGKEALKYPKAYQKDLKQKHLDDKSVVNMAI